MEVHNIIKVDSCQHKCNYQCHYTCYVIKSLSEVRLRDNPTCEMCLKEDESATHILCDCETIANLRFRHLGQFFMESSDCYDAPINRVLHFIRNVGLING
jgi:hypothetical protein